MFVQLKLDGLVRDGTYQVYLADEASHFSTMQLPPLEEQSRFNYIHTLQRTWKAQAALDAASRKYKIQPSLCVPLRKKLPAEVSRALHENNIAESTTRCLEVALGITVRWEPESDEYKEALDWASERDYRLALDKLERLVIQRLFELQKANLVSTGEFRVFEILMLIRLKVIKCVFRYHDT